MISQNKKQRNVIYKFINTITNKVYIGLTTKTFQRRYNSHKSSAFLPYVKHYNCKFYRSIRKHGWDIFKWEIIDNADTEQELKDKERYWISFYDSFRNGYNMTLGGDGTSGIMGEKHGQAKLTEDDVKRIKIALINGISQHDISSAYEVGQTMIANISTNHNWAHVEVDGWKEWQKLKANGDFIPPKYLNRDKGSKHRNAKLTEEQVVDIKRMLIDKISLRKIASKFNVSTNPINDIAKGLTWTHVEVDGWDEYQEFRKARSKAS